MSKEKSVFSSIRGMDVLTFVNTAAIIYAIKLSSDNDSTVKKTTSKMFEMISILNNNINVIDRQFKIVGEDFYNKISNEESTNNELLLRINKNEELIKELIVEVKDLKKRLSVYEDLQHPLIEKYSSTRSCKSWSETSSLDGEKTSKIR